MRIKTVEYSGPLWRADKNSSTRYSNTNIKYFALSEPEIQTYVVKAHKPYKNHWVTKEGQILNLVDILDLSTRKALELRPEISKKALNLSFPVNKNRVLRESDFNPDDIVLRGICALGYDGYFMKNLNNNNGDYVFHSEIGLCRTAFSKIELKETKINRSVAPSIKGKRTRRNNNNNNNTRRKPRFTMNNNNNTRRKPRFTMNNNNNNNNNNN